jgi:hypothetical protein
MEETGTVAIETERLFNKVDMRLQFLLAFFNVKNTVMQRENPRKMRVSTLLNWVVNFMFAS